MIRKKILMICNASYGMVWFRKGLITALASQGYDVVVMAPIDGGTEQLIKLPCQYIPIKIKTKSLNPIRDIILLVKLILKMRKIKPDISIHYTIKPNIYASMAAWVNNVPCLAVTTGLGSSFLSNNWLTAIVNILYRIAFQIPKQIWFLNEEDQSYFLDKRILKPEKARLIPGEGVDTSVFVPMAAKPQNGNFVFLQISRVLWDKGIREYFEAAKKIKEIYGKSVDFQLLGMLDSDNPTAVKETYVREFVDLGIINYLGTSDNVPSIIAQADCIVLPSYREGISKVLLEAAAMEKILIASDVPGCREVIDNNVNGLLIKSHNVADLVDKMIAVLNMSSDRRLMMGKKGREKVLMEFDEEIIISKYMKFISSVLR